MYELGDGVLFLQESIADAIQKLKDGNAEAALAVLLNCLPEPRRA